MTKYPDGHFENCRLFTHNIYLNNNNLAVRIK